jgi:hypothetical protein
MSFEDKYEILAELRNDGIKTFVGREKLTGQAVEVHLFLEGGGGANGVILEKIRGLAPENAQFVLERGDNFGTPYVVTHLLPDRRGLREWLDGIASGAPVFGGPTISDVEKGATLPPFRAPALQRGDTLPSFQAYDPSKGATLPSFQAPKLEHGGTLPPFQAYDPTKGATLPSFEAPTAPPPPDRGETLPPFKAMTTPPPKLGGSFDDTLPAGAGKKGADEDFLRLFQVPERLLRPERRGRQVSLRGCFNRLRRWRRKRRQRPHRPLKRLRQR